MVCGYARTPSEEYHIDEEISYKCDVIVTTPYIYESGNQEISNFYL